MSAVAVAASVLGSLAKRDVLIAPFTTYRLGGPAALFVDASDEATVDAVADAVCESGIDVLVIGQGSNLLVADAGFDGLVLHLGGVFESITIAEDPAASPAHPRTAIVTAGAAVKLPVLARRAAALGWRGLGWMVGVPGSVGGAVRMNAGGHGSDVRSNLVSARVVDLAQTNSKRWVTRSMSDLRLAYRSSAVNERELVVSATFAVEEGERAALDEEITEIVRWRRAHQPGGANCGSVFTNPPGDAAGRLIDVAGLRGYRLGSAMVSDKHANFIQADDGGSAADLWALIVHVRSVVHERFGVVLHPEVRTAGFDATLPALPALHDPDPTRQR